MTTNPSPVHVIGGGLAGSEACWQLIQAGVPVILHEMRGGTRNGQPITGSTAFDANGSRSGNYSGYLALGELAPGRKLAIPKKNYFAMGDNSANSQDSRYWGFVPAKDVVGRPLFVYYPFTKHWGPAR